MKHVAILLLLFVAACGGGSSKATAGATASVAPTAVGTAAVLTQNEQADAYLKAVAPANAALAEFKAKVNDQSTQAEVADAAETMATALEGVDSTLARIAFTGQAAVDVRSMIAVDGAFIGDLRAVRSSSAFSMSSLGNTISRDAGALNAAVTVVRADLGLPPKT
jgi:hypothetical protein